jgi:hypothetical protein
LKGGYSKELSYPYVDQSLAIKISSDSYKTLLGFDI